jgi:2-dehydropantoate 2-reductase
VSRFRYVVVGAGGVGGLCGGLLAAHGADVRFLVRDAARSGLRARPLTIEGPRSVTVAVRADDDAAAIGPVDVVLVAVKAWQVAQVAPTLRPLVGAGTIVVPLQNGVEAAGELEAALGPGHVAGGLCHMISWSETPGIIRFVGAPPQITMGARAGFAPPLEPIAAELRAAGIGVVVAEDPEAALWAKFLFIDGLSSVGAVTRAPVGALRSTPPTRALLVAAMREVEALARARGVHLPPTVVDDALARVERMPPDATASMQRDVMAGRPSELEQQTGAVVRLGRAHGVPTPVHDVLYAALLPQEQAARG